MRHLLPFFLCLFLLVLACANPGSGPDGGPYDEEPPRILFMSPDMGSTQSQTRKITIGFNEFIKVENAGEKIIVSPPQTETPEIKVAGKNITVKLLDTLTAHTTYTIDFSDAITDATEGNPLGNFTYSFSTGTQLDTMEVAGHVLAARNLEPVKGILVGLHANLSDSAFTTQPFQRVARTDASGHFCIKGVAPGTYHIYALDDMDGDFRKTRGERAAFATHTVTPSSFPDVRHDTLWTDTLHYDTIRTQPFTHFLPDDIVLLAFNENDTRRDLLKTQREVPEWWRAIFTAPSYDVPVVKGLNFNSDDAFLEQRNPKGDTITYWLKSLDRFPQPDTLHFTYTYQAFNDSLNSLVPVTDTLELIPRHTLARRLKQQAEELAKWEKQREKRHRRGDHSNETPPITPLRWKGPTPTRLAPDKNLTFGFEEPLQRLDTAAFHLYLLQDSLKIPAPCLVLPHKTDLLSHQILGNWRPGQRYRLEVDSAAATGLSGLTTPPLRFDFSIPKNEELGTLFLLLPDADSTAMVQLMQQDDKVLHQTPAQNGRADFFYLKPGKYYIRLFHDRNGNGEWDTGNYDLLLQPEEVFYYPEAIEVRANWDIEQTWFIHERPLNRQKPSELVKQKVQSAKSTARQRNIERARSLGRTVTP